MIEKKTLDLDALALRIKREMLPGQLVSVGSGLPNAIGKRLSYDPHAWLIDEDGELTPTTFSSDSFGNKHGSSFHSISDVAAMMHGGHVDIAIVEAGEVTASGDMVSVSTLSTTGLEAPGWSVDLLNNPNKSSVTNICPSHLFEAPIPITGIFEILFILIARFSVTDSNTTEKEPACSTVLRSLIIFFSSLYDLPKTLYFLGVDIF